MNNLNAEDIIKRQQFLGDSYTQFSALMLGIQAIAFDFEFIRRIPLNNSKIFQIRSEIYFRIDSTRFQFEQLVKMLDEIYFKGEKIDNETRLNPLPLIMNSSKLKVSYLLENIIFNITSLFDYFAILINYVVAKTDRTYDWNKLQSYAKGNSGIFSIDNTGDLKNVILDVHNVFVDKLYNYRSELIHRKSDVVLCEGSHDYANDKIYIQYFCTEKQLKTFGLGNKQKQTVTFLAEKIYELGVYNLIKLIQALKNFQFNLKVDETKPIQTMFEYDKNKQPISLGMSYWALFDNLVIMK